MKKKKQLIQSDSRGAEEDETSMQEDLSDFDAEQYLDLEAEEGEESLDEEQDGDSFINDESESEYETDSEEDAEDGNDEDEDTSRARSGKHFILDEAEDVGFRLKDAYTELPPSKARSRKPVISDESEPEEGDSNASTAPIEIERPDEEGGIEEAEEEDEDVSVDEDEEAGAEAESDEDVAQPPETLSDLQENADEIKNLKDDVMKYGSTLFRLQLEELFSEVMVTPRTRRKVDDLLESLKTIFKEMPIYGPLELGDERAIEESGVKYPLIRKPKDVKGNFIFVPPVNIEVVGLYAANAALKKNLVVDVVVEVPHKCWREHDYLNQKYFRKRAMYLSLIAKFLKEDPRDIIDDAEFGYSDDHLLKPVLYLTLKKKYKFRLSLVPPQDTFKLSRFRPSNNNVRSAWFFDEEKENTPTPHYNSLIVEDINLRSTSLKISDCLKESDEVRKAVIMLETWLQRRPLSASVRKILSSFLVYLMEKKKVSKHMSCYQIFRNVLHHLSLSAWDSQGISLAEETPIDMEQFHQYYDVVFMDHTGYHNICHDIPADVYADLKREAKITLDCLELDNSKTFENTFIHPIHMSHKFDAVLMVSSSAIKKLFVMEELIGQQLDYGTDLIEPGLGYLISLLKRGLCDSVLLLARHIEAKDALWPITQPPPDLENYIETVQIGIIFNPEKILETVYKSSPANTPGAEKFRDFWGEMSQMSRFPDSSICEAVFWKGDSLELKRTVCKQAVRTIFQRHANISRQGWSLHTFAIEDVIRLRNLKKDTLRKFKYGTGEETASQCLKQCDAFFKILRRVQGLPLEISSIQGISPIFRGSEVFPPLCGHIALPKEKFKRDRGVFYFSPDSNIRPSRFVPQLEAIVHLESSGKWPNDLAAFRRVKAAFHLELASKLKQHGLLTKANPNYVDVWYESYAIRVRIASFKEILLLRSFKDEHGIIKKRDSKEADDLETLTETLPQISSALNGVNMKYHCYSAACRIAKRWISSQLLCGHIEDVAVELIMAYVFIHPQPYSVPNSPVTAFLRFLAVIAHHNWKINPLIVNINGQFSAEEIKRRESDFVNNRPHYPPMFITTPFDKRWSQWTTELPIPPVLNRLVILAKISEKILCQQLVTLKASDFKIIFRPTLDVYDVIIYLNKDQLAKLYQQLDNTEQVRQYVQPFIAGKKEGMAIVAYDPADAYVSSLRQVYGDVALFFYDPLGGNVVGALWRPKAFEKQSVISGGFSRPSETSSADGKAAVEPNFEAILEDFKILGKGLVEDVKIKPKEWLGS